LIGRTIPATVALPEGKCLASIEPLALLAKSPVTFSEDDAFLTDHSWRRRPEIRKKSWEGMEVIMMIHSVV
jgi:hypothetical protein